MKKAALLFLLFLLLGCEKADESPSTPSPTPGAAPVRIGAVMETIDVGTYTYIRLDEHGREIWIATNPVWVSEGDKVKFSGGSLMKDFHSETLNRTFDYILFVNQIETANQNDADKAIQQSISSQVAAPHAGVAATASGLDAPVDVAPLDDGITIAMLYASHVQLEGQLVNLSAQVMKVNSNIMGKNWITLVDGTGTAPDNKLVATTSEIVSVGEKVIVKGTVKNDVVLGAGYNYKVLLEDASFSQ